MDLAQDSRLRPLAGWLQARTRRPRELLRGGLRPHDEIPLGTALLLGLYLLVQTVRQSSIADKAGSTAYSLVFSLIPLVTTTLALFTAIPGLESERENLRDAVFGQLIPSAVEDVETYLRQFSERAAQAGVVSSIVFLAVMLLVLKNLEQVFNDIWRVPRNRTWAQRVQVLSLFFLVGGLAVATMVSITRELYLLRQRIDGLDLVPTSTAVPGTLLEAGNIFVACALFTLANKVLPNTRVSWRAAVLGGVLAGLLFSTLKEGFTWYINSFASYENIYGALGLIPAFFLWVYLSMLVLLLGGYISFVSQNLRTLLAIQHAGHVEPRLAYHAVTTVAALARAFKDGTGPVDATRLAHTLGVSEYLLEQALVPLCRAGIVLTLGEGAHPRYSLARPAESVTVGRLVALVSGEELQIPDVDAPHRLHDRVSRLFALAHHQEGSVLEQVTVADLVPDVPALR